MYDWYSDGKPCWNGRYPVFERSNLGRLIGEFVSLTDAERIVRIRGGANESIDFRRGGQTWTNMETALRDGKVAGFFTKHEDLDFVLTRFEDRWPK